MSTLQLFRVALRALAINKLRSALTMLGIVIGVGAVIVMIAVGAGAQKRVEEQIRALGSNLLLVTPGATTAGGVRLGFGSSSTLSEDDVVAINRDIPEALAAIDTLHARGPGAILVTSLHTDATPADSIDIVASDGQHRFLVRTPKLPISVNGLGTIELTFVVLLGLMGVDAEVALAVAILRRLVLLGQSLVGGVLYSARRFG